MKLEHVTVLGSHRPHRFTSYAISEPSGRTQCCGLASDSGSGFDRKFAATLNVSNEAHLFAGLFVAEAAQSNRFLSRFRHEPRSLTHGPRVFAPCTLNHVSRKKVELTHTSGFRALAKR